ncbi:epoxide hydrolase family protein [Aspergillus clavatus NRRL 1]|uniref:Epoxide hydrolase, putative n=1 Tax=Aspergillus clavatus (strain ATCC 1007 / CBS 513.65 / DSM 816 / NCTC 3887 / NRRL 1 / QM 1276 / 107) TaxID=344612 RepID=A1CK14_ASPCL|nr:epoxide hydrolase, putative [Aspergillus clavatus NRRL 1]EAW09488.1 epoxide hydrolase, putative [Aspergillus clavatus NRRL 1]
MSIPYSKLPPSAKISPDPFHVDIPDENISEFKALVKLSKLAPPTYEDLQQDRRYGVTSDWLNTMREKWLNSYDWRETETRINGFPQFTTKIEDVTLHFAALFSEKADAIPVILLHGWPGSFLEFLPILKLFKEEYAPDTLPFHLIVPSLPGYGFSSGPPLDREYTSFDVARVFDQLMKGLGFEAGYVTQGGDIGSRLSRVLAVEFESCKVNFCTIPRPQGSTDENLTDTEKRGVERLDKFMTTGTAYAIEQGTRPSTIGHILSTNPMALLAWVGEKFLDWVDDPLPSETILDFVSLYWFTETYPRAIYFYREDFPHRRFTSELNGRYFIHKPFGFSYFPKELYPAPRPWIATTGNLVFFQDHQKAWTSIPFRSFQLTNFTQGGHFAALERPQDLKKDLTEFIEQVWPGIAPSK